MGKRLHRFAGLGLLGLCLLAAAQTAPDAELKSRILAFFNRVIGYQGLDKIEIGSLSPPDSSGMRTLVMHFSKGKDTLDKTFTISPDTREIVEGDADGTAVSVLSGDPWAAVRAKLQLQGAPEQGPATAPVTIVEFSDLECPYCKQEAGELQKLIAADPSKVRVYFKFFPLTSLHPWAMRAALAGECVAEQGSAEFWRFEQATFDHQDELTPENAAARLRDFAVESGAKPAAFDACVVSPATTAKVEASIADGKSVNVQSTPTVYLDGREIPGAVDEATLLALVNHELQLGPANSLPGGIKSGGPSGPQCSGDCKPLPPLPAAPARGSGGGGGGVR